MVSKKCCFIGHRKIELTDQRKANLTALVERLIVDENVDCFLFGSQSDFNTVCLDIVTGLQGKYPHIRRIEYRTNYPDPDEYTKQFLGNGYDDSICPDGVGKSGKATYAERNQKLIDDADICVFYYDENYLPPRRKISKRNVSDYQPKSGTRLAFEYAQKSNKTVINLLDK